MAVCVLMGCFEALTMMNYGDPDYENIFTNLVGYFPDHFTMHENVSFIDFDMWKLKLLRSMFPALV